ncbi:MAG: ADP-ribosylglycohydrolase family protein [Planctomycetota bacterium]|nr:ADP-ribosylglycohydrolase family protein [Planctomycetota bacterium]
MPGWTSLRSLVNSEFYQSHEEGRDPAAIEALRPAFEQAGNDERRLRAVWADLLALPIRTDFPFHEPSDLEGIRAARPGGRADRPTRPHSLSDAALLDRMHGAWLGRCAGCALGKPVEAFMESHNGLTSRGRIKAYLQAVAPHEYPLRDYFPAQSPAKDRTGPLGWSSSTREKIAFMESDDDIRYTVIGQKILMAKGPGFTTHDVARAWLAEFPYRTVCTAETQAYRNLVIRGDFHQDPTKSDEIDWNWIATNDNPYREWIGAQIRADPWGYAAPGRPTLAAEFAWRDARLSHVKNGIYGEMFCAAMIAVAFVLDDPAAIVEAGLAEIPGDSRLYCDISATVCICDRFGRDPAKFEAVIDEIDVPFGKMSPVHTINNAALVVVALLLSGGDFERAITLAVMGGWDTDCNGATAGSIIGAMVGAARLPKKWIAPLNDTLRSELVGYDPISISECAKRSAAIAKEVSKGTAGH